MYKLEKTFVDDLAPKKGDPPPQFKSFKRLETVLLGLTITANATYPGLIVAQGPENLEKQTWETMKDGDYLLQASEKFSKRLEFIKASTHPVVQWYPYGILNNFIHLRNVFNRFPLDALASNPAILDIGAADGDLAFFLESEGFQTSIIDNPPTNYNMLKGAYELRSRLKSKVTILQQDIDKQFDLGPKSYDVTFLLGILYHLKNPFYVLERICEKSKYLILSTRVARYIANNLSIKEHSLVYLLDELELNNDTTNFFVFSERGLKMIFKRSGWEVLEYYTIGDTVWSNPSDMSRDERAFVLLKSTKT